jgi:hypothetical protein
MRSGFSARLSARLSVAVLAACVVSVVAAAATPALAGLSAERRLGRPPDRPLSGPQPPTDFGDMLFGRPPADTRSPAMPRLARFRADTGDTFVLEITARGPAYLKYDDSGEVWALNASTVSRGDTIYKNDVGEAMLRATRLGGLTVFTQDRPGGVAAALEGGAADLHDMISGPIAILRVLVQASARASQIAGHRVDFEAGCPARSKPRNACPAEADLMPGSEGVFADAANLAAQAFARVDHLGRPGHDALSRYDKVAIFNGHPPSVSVVGDEVHIVVTPELGFAGRPSSLRISQMLFRR